MEPLLYVMAIMGCADGGELCQEARLSPVRYTSFQACQLAMDDQLLLNSDLAYPTIAAQCRSTRINMARAGQPGRG